MMLKNIWYCVRLLFILWALFVFFVLKDNRPGILALIMWQCYGDDLKSPPWQTQEEK
jgi:hypothetical protein